MKNTFKLFSIIALTSVLSACGESNPSEALVMQDFQKVMDRKISESRHFEKIYAEMPQAAEVFGPNERVPSSTLQELLASGKFTACRKGEYDGQLICGVEISLGESKNSFEFAYVKNGEAWESMGQYRKPK